LLPLVALSGGADPAAIGASGQANTAAHDPGPLPVRQPASVRPRMREHFTQVAAIRDAIIQADLSGVRTPATRLATAQHEGLPTAAQPFIGEVQRLAAQVGAAETLLDAAAGMARLAAACGNCHVSVEVHPTLLAVMPRGEDTSLKGQMRRHYRAVDQLYRGLVVPSTISWNAGVEALSSVRHELLRTRSGEPATPEVQQLAQQLDALAKDAAAAGSQGDRWPLYGKMLTTCSDCHRLQGIVVSPGRDGR
jgi:mono/diheme cytochrome c family protein